MSCPAKHAFLNQLVRDGVSVVFGNPGTFEQGFLDAIRDHPALQYVLCLSEPVAVAAATNYAKLSRGLGVVQLHAGVGLGNAIGALQEAFHGRVPLLVYCGENTREAEAFEGYLSGDLVELARPVTRWATRVVSASQILRLTRRAISRALAPPRGPVLISVPMDVFDVSIADDGQKTVFPDTRVAPRAEVIEHVASMLHEAAQPMFLIGDDVSWSGAHSELLEVAHRTRASIYGMGLTMAGSLLSDPAFAGFMPVTSGTSVAEITRKADLILAIGASLGTEIMPRTTADYLSAGARLIEVASSPIELGRNLLPEHAIQADPRCFLGLVDRELEKRGATTKPAKLQRVGDTESPTQETLDSGVFTSATMMRMIAAEAPTDAVLVDESMSATEELRTALRGKVGLTYQSCHARGIGSGLPAAVAAKLVFPSRPVISVSADGAALYVLPSLWTAAHLKLDVVFVIYNNRAYRVLKANLLDYWRGLGEGTRSFPFMDLDPPPIRFTQIAEGMGVSGTAATDAESLRSALASALLTRGPHLIEVELPGEADTLA